MSERWRNGAKAALGAGDCGGQSPRVSRCGEHAQALTACTCPPPVSQWRQVRLRRPLAPGGNTTNSREQPSPGARLVADNDVVSGRATAFGTGLEQLWVDATGEAQRGTIGLLTSQHVL